MNIKKIALSVVLSLIMLSAQAQYLGPNSHVANTVSEVLKNSVDDQPVVLEGYLIKKVAKKKYLFSDGTGVIRVEIDREKFHAPITEKTKVRLTGEIDEIEKDFTTDVEVDVDRIEIISENIGK